jgi:lipoprotein-anchoring transpeptidase ErfK/SrfK
MGQRLLAVAIVGAVTTAPTAAAISSAHPRMSVVAQASGDAVRVYRFPEASKPFLTLRSPTPNGGRLVFLVVQRLPGWERVRLPVRPNGATGWVRDRSVALSLDPYRLVVSLSHHRLELWKGATLVRTERAAVGRTLLPTPAGEYYLAELFKQPDPSGPYGPFAFGLSAFSNVLYRFGSGPGEIGLHGTNDPNSLGTSVSHGCIRISNRAVTILARTVPLGTPVVIAH